GGSFHIEIDNHDVTGTLAVSGGGWQAWKNVKAEKVTLQEGLHILKFVTNGGMNLNYITISESFLSSAGLLPDHQLLVYPNPSADGNFHFQLTQPGHLTIALVNGKVIYNQSLGSGTQQVDLSNFTKGVYLASLVTKSGISRCKLIYSGTR
ncbi:MAG: T9SS type A sorting domain-containing protein, partial [Methylococcaceae bacterium]